MKKIALTALVAALLDSLFPARAADTSKAQPEPTPVETSAPAIEPDGTYLFAVKDKDELYLDIYYPTQGSVVEIDGKRKPTILYIFGGGFSRGQRTANSQWFKLLCENGYTVVAGDYRLGLKDFSGAGFNRRFLKAMGDAIDMAVEDLFSATNFLIDNAEELGIDPSDIVVAGASAGAITALQAEWEICNSMKHANSLPDGFNYAGVMSFSGAVFSKTGGVKYGNKPCPTLLMHGTEDKIVTYRQYRFMNLHFAGCTALCKALDKAGASFRAYHFSGNGHEVCYKLEHLFGKQAEFLENAIVKGLPCRENTVLCDPAIEVPDKVSKSFKSLY